MNRNGCDVKSSSLQQKQERVYRHQASTRLQTSGLWGAPEDVGEHTGDLGPVIGGADLHDGEIVQCQLLRAPPYTVD